MADRPCLVWSAVLQEVLKYPRAELQRFVAPEGWPLSALRAQMSLQSPVLRHALRAALAQELHRKRTPHLRFCVIGT